MECRASVSTLKGCACARTRRYNLHLFEREGTIKEALGTMLEAYPDVRAVLLGARNTDPYYGEYV